MALPVALKLPTLTKDERDTVVTALFIAEDETLREFRSEDELRRLNQLSLNHSEVRQQYFWRRIAFEESRGKRSEPQPYRVFGFTGRGVQPAGADFSWLIVDAEHATEEHHRTLAFSEALHAWWINNRPGSELRSLRRLTRTQPKLRAQLSQFVWRCRTGPWKHRWYKLDHHRIMLPTYCRKLTGRFLAPFRRYKTKRWLQRNRSKLEAGELPNALAHFARESRRSGSSWAANAWTGLERRRGPEVARTIRIGCKHSWLLHAPPLPHEQKEGSISNATIVGLTGLLALFLDGELNYAGMSASQAELATRYALCEMNELPPWFSGLAMRHPAAVDAVMKICLEQEWDREIPNEGAPEVLRHLSYGDEPAPPVVVERVLTLLEAREPRSLGALFRALTLLLRARVGRERLVATAQQRVGGSELRTRAPAYWFAAWLQLEAAGCLSALEPRLKLSGADELMQTIASVLCEDDMRGMPSAENRQDLLPSIIRQTVPLFYTHVRPTDDRDTFSDEMNERGQRDYAQQYRNGLIMQLAGSIQPGAGDTLRALADEPILASRHDWILHLYDEHLAQDVASAPWKEQDFRDFVSRLELPPANDEELYQLVLRRLAEIKYLVEGGDLTPRAEVRAEDQEEKLRRMLARHLQERSAGLYEAVEESEIDRRERPDLRVVQAPLAPVAIEVKKDDWTAAQLLERLENQLIGQYLRDERNFYGIFFIGRVTPKQTWEYGAAHLNFAQLLMLLEARATELVAAHARPIGVKVFTIDFRPPVRPVS